MNFKCSAKSYTPFFVMLIFFAMQVLHSEEPFSQGKIKITASVLNVRNISSLGGTVVGTVKRGDILQVIDRSPQQSEVDGLNDYWYKVALPGSKNGWIFGGYLTFELNLESGLKWRSVNPSPSENFTGIISPSLNSILAGTEQGNLYSSSDNGRSWKKIVPQALGNNIGPLKKLVMQKNVIWIISTGAAGGGVWKTANSGASWAQYRTDQGLPSNDINDIFIANNGEIWAVTSQGIASSTNNGMSWQKFENNRGLKGDPLSITMVNSNLLVGTTKGIFVLVYEGNLLGGKKGRWVQAAEKQITSNVESLYHSDGMVYAGTNKGLARSDASSLTEWFIIGGSSKVRTILIDGRKRIIVATTNGLNISLDKGDSWVTYKKEHGLTSNSINSVAVDQNNNIWLTMERSGISFHD